MSARAARLAALWVGVLVGACGAGPAAAPSTATRTRAPLELTLRASNGAFVDVGDLHDAPTLLFVFATFDSASQAALRPLKRFFREHPDVHVLGVAAQPDARALIAAYGEALSVPFLLTYDPVDAVTEGRSALGRVSVPSYFALDADGVLAGQHVGFASESVLERLLSQARHEDIARE